MHKLDWGRLLILSSEVYPKVIIIKHRYSSFCIFIKKIYNTEPPLFIFYPTKVFMKVSSFIYI